MRVALYHRVSTLDQNPELARDELRAAALGRGGVVVLDVEETGSGAKNNRPGLGRVMEAARAGKLDAVLCWKLDRFGRSTLDLLTNVRELGACGVRFVATTQGLDVGGKGGSGAMGQLILTVMAGMAEFERELIRERTTLGMAAARKAGKRIGRPRAVLAAATLARAGELRARGLSWRGVRRALATDGIAGLPSFATLARECTKGAQKIRTDGPRKPGTSEGGQ